jgi:ferric-dicitrate binding protein FerR (iron transport regulator)
MSRSSDELLNAYLDGALDAAERGNVERDLERDPSLAAKLAALRDLDEALANIASPAGNDAAIVAQVERTLRPQSIPRSPWPLILATALGLAAGFLLAVEFERPADPSSLDPAIATPHWTKDPSACAYASKVIGRPERMHRNSKGGEPIAADTNFVAGDTVFLAADDRMVVDGRDESRVYLAANSVANWGDDGRPALREGRAVFASAQGSDLTFDAGEATLTVVDGACAAEIEVFQSKVAKKIPETLLRVVVVRGELIVGDRRFAAGSSLAIADGLVSEDQPPIDSQWFVELATQLSAR